MFITVLTGEQRDPDELAALAEVVEALDIGRINLVASSLLGSEILSGGPADDVIVRLELLFRKPNFVRIDVSSAISTRAGSIRQAAAAAGRKIRTPDAIHIATALAAGASALHTFDAKLLKLDASPIVDGLTICKPRGEQTVLRLL